MSQFEDIVARLFADRSAPSRNLLDHEPLYWARQYLDRADHLFSNGKKRLDSRNDRGGSGDLRSGALYLWRSCLCAIIAVAQKSAWPTETREDLIAVVEELSNELEEPVLIDGFEAAKIVRGYGNLSAITNGELDAAWVRTTNFVTRLLELAD